MKNSKANNFSAVLIFWFIFGFSGDAAAAAEDRMIADYGPTPRSFARGVVSSVDLLNSQLIVKVGTKHKAFTVLENSLILRGDNTLGLNDVFTSPNVAVEYYEDPNGELIATAVRVANSKL